ncbi:hypothetical protein FJZ39_04255 [Candidatus Saccharibacteria bacterium]|nr:hypothetical protein [Candidatus Saccharibacteria bacterium]
MKPHIFAVRAIASQLVLSFVVPLFFIYLAAVTAFGGIVWLLATHVHELFWLLLIPLVVVAGVIGIVLLAGYIISKLLHPNLSLEQQKVTKEFISHVQEVAETVRTPYPLLVGRVVFDLVRYRRSPFLENFIQTSGGLHKEYASISATLTNQQTKKAERTSTK